MTLQQRVFTALQFVNCKFCYQNRISFNALLLLNFVDLVCVTFLLIVLSVLQILQGLHSLES